MNDIKYSDKLQLNYKIKYDKYNNRVVVFEDDVNYRDNEMSIIKNFDNKLLKKIHLIKKIFQGIIIK